MAAGGIQGLPANTDPRFGAWGGSGLSSGYVSQGGTGGQAGGPQAGWTPEDYYRYQQSMPQATGWNTKWSKFERGKLPPGYWGNVPGQLASAQISSVLSDPYDVSRSGFQGQLAGANRAYDVMRQKVGAGQLGSGASGGGVARGGMGNVEQGRARDLSDAYRQYEMYRQQMGDQRLQSLGLGYMDRYNQAVGSARGQQTGGGGGSSGMDMVQGVLGLMAAACWVAREVYGEGDMRWLAARHWMLNDSPEDFRKFYLENGERIALHVRNDPAARAEWREMFDRVL